MLEASISLFLRTGKPHATLISSFVFSPHQCMDSDIIPRKAVRPFHDSAIQPEACSLFPRKQTFYSILPPRCSGQHTLSSHCPFYPCNKTVVHLREFFDWAGLEFCRPLPASYPCEVYWDVSCFREAQNWRTRVFNYFQLVMTCECKHLHQMEVCFLLSHGVKKQTSLNFLMCMLW